MVNGLTIKFEEKSKFVEKNSRHICIMHAYILWIKLDILKWY